MILINITLAVALIASAIYSRRHNFNVKTSSAICVDFTISFIVFLILNAANIADPVFYYFMGFKSIFVIFVISRYHIDDNVGLCAVVLFAISILNFATALEEMTGYSHFYDKYVSIMIIADALLIVGIVRPINDFRRKNLGIRARFVDSRIAVNRGLDN